MVFKFESFCILEILLKLSNITIGIKFLHTGNIAEIEQYYHWHQHFSTLQ